MSRLTVVRFLILAAVLTFIGFMAVPEAPAHVEKAYTLAEVVKESDMITLMRVTRVDKANKLVVFEKVEDIKGKFPTQTARHLIAGELHEKGIKVVLDWAEVGKLGMFFAQGTACEMCIDNYWYQIYKNGDDLYGMTHGEPYLLRSFCGKVSKLPGMIKALNEGKEILVPAMEDDKVKNVNKTARIARMKTSMKGGAYDFKRDFAGWGAEDVRALTGVPGFQQIGPLATLGPTGKQTGLIDIDGDNKPDIYAISHSKVGLFLNQGDSFPEAGLPNLRGGANSIAWGDFDGNGKPDVLLATNQGLRLFSNQGGGTFRDDSTTLPREAQNAVTSAAQFLDVDGDGKPDIVCATQFGGIKIYKNERPTDAATKVIAPVMGDWMYCGAFPNNFDKAFVPEKEVDFTKTYAGKEGQVGWKKGNFKDGAINNLAIFGKGELNTDASVYLAREITCSDSTELPISLGSDDGLLVFANGEKLLAENTGRACTPDQHHLILNLQKGKNILLLKVTQGGGDWAYYFKAGEPKVNTTGWFKDVTTSMGLSDDLQAKWIELVDVDGDGKTDLLLGASTGVILKNTGAKFEKVADSGLNFDPSKGLPALGDFDGDGKIDLVIPQGSSVKLYKNVGGKFEDVTAKSGDLAKVNGTITSVAFGDFDNNNKPCLFVGRYRAGNRFLRNNADGTFTDATADLGIQDKIYNTSALVTGDLNNDGKLDVVMVNENQDTAVLFGNKELVGKGLGVTIVPPGKCHGFGTVVKLKNSEGKVVREAPLQGASRFVVAPGTYSVEITGTGFTAVNKSITVAPETLRFAFDPPPAPLKTDPEPKKQ